MKKAVLATTIFALGLSSAVAADPTPQEKAQTMCNRFSRDFNNKDLNAQLAHYKDDAVVIGANGITTNQEQRAKGFSEAYKILSNHHCTVEQAAAIANDVFWGGGTWRMTLTTDTGPQEIGGYFSVVWSGPWPNSKAIVETWNNKAEPPPTQAAGSSK